MLRAASLKQNGRGTFTPGRRFRTRLPWGYYLSFLQDFDRTTGPPRLVAVCSSGSSGWRGLKARIPQCREGLTAARFRA
jgi:hypothetical protein